MTPQQLMAAADAAQKAYSDTMAFAGALQKAAREVWPGWGILGAEVGKEQGASAFIVATFDAFRDFKRAVEDAREALPPEVADGIAVANADALEPIEWPGIGMGRAWTFLIALAAPVTVAGEVVQAYLRETEDGYSEKWRVQRMQQLVWDVATAGEFLGTLRPRMQVERVRALAWLADHPDPAPAADSRTSPAHGSGTVPEALPGFAPTGPTVQEAFTTRALADFAKVSERTVTRYAKKVGANRPGSGQSDYAYPRGDVVAILECLAAQGNRDHQQAAHKALDELCETEIKPTKTHTVDTKPQSRK